MKAIIAKCRKDMNAKHVKWAKPLRSLRYQSLITRGLCLFLFLLSVPGCQLIGYFVAASGGEREVDVEAEYDKLTGKTGAVFVMAPARIRNRYPGAMDKISHAISHRLVESNVAAKLVDPEQVLAYQDRNPAWYAIPYDELARQLKLERLIFVDLSEYQITPEGDIHTLKAEVTGGIGVYELKADRKPRFDYYTEVTVRLPEDEPAALLEDSVEDMQNQIVQMYSEKVGNLFMDHVEIKSVK